MTEKRKRINIAIISTILFVIFLIVELCLIRVFDKKIGNEQSTVLISAMKRALNDTEETTTYLEEAALSPEEDSYSDILGRELTEKEMNNQKELWLRCSNIVYSNIGGAAGVRLPDGNWLVDDDPLYIKVNNDKNDSFIFMIDDVDIRNEYRKYTEDSYYDCSFGESVGCVGSCSTYYQICKNKVNQSEPRA